MLLHVTTILALSRPFTESTDIEQIKHIAKELTIEREPWKTADPQLLYISLWPKAALQGYMEVVLKLNRTEWAHGTTQKLFEKIEKHQGKLYTRYNLKPSKISGNKHKTLSVQCTNCCIYC